MSRRHRWNSLEHGEPRPWAPDLIGRVIARYAAWVLAAVALSVSPVGAQEMERFDPDEAYGSAPARQVDPAGSGEAESDVVYGSTLVDEGRAATIPAPGDLPGGTTAPGVQGEGDALPPDANAGTYGEDDLIGAAEGVFGKGAQGLAKLIEDLLRKQGEPNAYIVGREAGGAFVFGARYGSGTLHHKIEGERKVYWTGPSVGFDAGANAANTFVLVYNLFDTQDIFKRYPAGEGQAYFVGGLHASYMRRGDVVLIPIRMGAGLRLGVNAGYMRFSEKQRWVPF